MVVVALVMSTNNRMVFAFDLYHTFSCNKRLTSSLNSLKMRLSGDIKDSSTATDFPKISTKGYIPTQTDFDTWEGRKSGFDWELERARRAVRAGFAPISMTLWQPKTAEYLPPPGTFDNWSILFNNGLQMLGLKKSVDGAPLVQGVNTFKGSVWQMLSRVADGDLAELAGGPLFLLLAQYYRTYGPVFKLAFGPKSFIVVSDPVMVKHILKENPHKYDKGILAEILQPIMGKGLIPADPETWKVRRKAIVPGFHKAWLNAMVSYCSAVLCNIDCDSVFIHALSLHTAPFPYFRCRS